MPKNDKKVNNNLKSKYWTFIGYPESLPSDWETYLKTEIGLPIAISPLHDADLNADDSEKKPHYHFILCYTHSTTFSCIKKITDRLNCPIPKPISSIKGLYRYFTHEDNPEKAQYDKKDIKHLNGFCLSDYVSLSGSDRDAFFDEIEDYIFQNNIKELVDLVLGFKVDGKLDLLSVLRTNTIYFNALLKSQRMR